MSFIREDGQIGNLQPVAMTASVAVADGNVVVFSSGLATNGTSSSNADTICGIFNGTIASTDADYATSGKLRSVDIPRPRFDRYVVDVNASDTIAQSNVGTFCDLGDAGTIKPNTNTKHHVFIERLLNTSGGANGTGQAVVTFASQVS